jgi:hypothetical protein
LGFLNNTFAYNPLTQGAILSIDASTDKNIITNAPQLPPGQFYTNTFRPLIEQDGMFYLASIAGPTFTHGGTTGFNTISQNGFLAADFTQFDFSTGMFSTSHPNFAGDHILLGLGQLTTFGPKVRFRAIYDNLQFTINSRVPDAGGTLLLLLSSAGVLFLFRTTLRHASEDC